RSRPHLPSPFPYTTLFRSLAWPLPSGAAEEAKANTLTPQEIAQGWLLFFDGDSTFGWKISGEAKVANGQLVLGGANETTAVLTRWEEHTSELQSPCTLVCR